MAEVYLDNREAPVPSADNTGVLYIDSVTKQGTLKNGNGRTDSLPGRITNYSTIDQAVSTAQLNINGSKLFVPTHKLQVGTMFRWRVVVTKTAAGTASPIWRIKLGTTGTNSDANVGVFTQVASQTGDADTCIVDITTVFRKISSTFPGAPGSLQSMLSMTHANASTGFSTLGTNVQSDFISSFDTITIGLIASLSFLGGASFSGTIQAVSAEMLNI